MTPETLFAWGVLVGLLTAVACASIAYAVRQQLAIVRDLRHRHRKLGPRDLPPLPPRSPNHPVGPATGGSSG